MSPAVHLCEDPAASDVTDLAMPIVLGPLLTNFSHLMSSLWQTRMQKPVSHLLPNWADPGLLDPIPREVSENERMLRSRLAGCAEQLRAIGQDIAVREVLRQEFSGVNRQVLLAASGFASWRPVGSMPWAVQSRRSADGMIYMLET